MMKKYSKTQKLDFKTRDDFVPGPQGEVYPTLRLYKNLGGALSMKHFLLLSS